jgi:RsiW-degrading membrane proteinase PrsW (M82 family)
VTCYGVLLRLREKELLFHRKNKLVMPTKQRLSRSRQNAKERDEMRKFLLIVVAATLALMVLMYFIFR